MHWRPERPAVSSRLTPVRELNDVEASVHHGCESEIAIGVALGPAEMTGIGGVQRVEAVIGIGRVLVPDLVTESPAPREEVCALDGASLKAGISDEPPQRRRLE